MACRECEWWMLIKPKSDGLGRCDFPMPESVDGVDLMPGQYGEGCPQFKPKEPRSDGE